MSAYLLVSLLAQAEELPSTPEGLQDVRPPVETADRVRTMPTQDALELSWADAEERLQGAVRPNPPIAGQPARVSVSIGSFEGKHHDGPVTLAVKCQDARYAESATVLREDGGVAWAADFRPPEASRCVLDVTWQTTHTKVVHAPFEVVDAPTETWPWWVALGVAAAAVIAALVRSALRPKAEKDR